MSFSILHLILLSLQLTSSPIDSFKATYNLPDQITMIHVISEFDCAPYIQDVSKIHVDSTKWNVFLFDSLRAVEIEFLHEQIAGQPSIQIVNDGTFVEKFIDHFGLFSQQSFHFQINDAAEVQYIMLGLPANE